MVDTDILIQIWKNRVKKIDFVLKWLSRVGSEVGPTKVLCEGNTRNRWRDGQVCPDVDKELWRLGPDGSGEKKRSGKEGTRRPGRRDPGESSERGRKESGGRERTERRETRGETGEMEKGAESGEIGEKKKKAMNAGGVANGI
ncbi:hypothetical protein TNCV_4552091 [Trichonephila clavipes]|nr:hypothetical protein TNCV_4552091 [Trichonephila clavipes]